jgi:glycosyltransferase involved in cell wall biosynthesis
LTSNIQFVYHGEIENKEVSRLFSKHHLFLFPTFGENFGHVIAESLLNGCLTLTSNETPWSNMSEFGAGADYPLEDELRFIEYIKTVMDMDESLFETNSKNAITYARSKINNESIVKKYLDLFS